MLFPAAHKTLASAPTCLQAACKELRLVHGSTQQQARLTAWQRQHCEQQMEHVRALVTAATTQLWDAWQPSVQEIPADEWAIKGMLREHGLGDLTGGLRQASMHAGHWWCVMMARAVQEVRGDHPRQAGMCQQPLRVCHTDKSCARGPRRASCAEHPGTPWTACMHSHVPMYAWCLVIDL